MEPVKKDSILLAAARAFAQHGFRKASIDEIARAAGVAKGTVYLACDSKEDLFYQVVHRELRAWIADCSRLIDPRLPADEILGPLSDASLAQLATRPLVRDLLCGRLHELLPRWRDRLQELRDLGRASLVELLELGVRQRRFRADTDVNEVASLLLDLQLTTALFHDSDGSSRGPGGDRRRRAGLDLVLEGLRTK